MSNNVSSSQNLKDPVHIFWTGGWDSSFRVCQLVIDKQIPVQPIFVHSMRKAGGQRLNVTHELQAIELMLADLANNFPAAAELIKPFIYISPAELYSKEALNSIPIVKGPGLGDGWQYHILGTIAACWNKPIELSIEKSNDGHNPVGDSLIPHVEPAGHSFQLKKELPSGVSDGSDMLCIEHFKYFHFPLLFTTRAEMRTMAEKGGYLEIIEQSWSCIRYRPDNSQCGQCYCCQGRIRDGVWKEKPFSRWLS